MASLESINSFEQGMQSDFNKFKQPPNSYLEALNFRLIGDLGQSHAALVNIKGNEFKLNIPNTNAVYRITKGNTSIFNTTITINGISSGIISVTDNTTGADIYSVVSGMSNFNIDFFAAFYQDHIVIWSETIDPNPILSNAGLAFETQYAQVGTNYWVAPQSNLIPIGSTYIRDDIYVFTTPTSSVPNTLDNSGQIFKLTYDVVSKIATLKLIYNNYINFTIDHPIPPTGAHGRFENDNIQRIYWTDNFNKLRSLNVTDPNIMAFPEPLLNIFPQVDGFAPILDTTDQTGSLLLGVYQYAYRLKKANGQLTLWSQLSLPINLCNNQPDAAFTGGANWQYYIGLNAAGSTPSNKSITCNIGKLDLNYDFIDICYIRRKTYNDVGTLEIFQQNIPVPTSGFIKFTHTGNETNNLPLTLNEFLATSPGFTHCKTIDTKDNRLFVGNVRIDQEDLAYDARAYQFGANSNFTLLTNNGITLPGGYDQTALATLPDNHDAINETLNPSFYSGSGNGLALPNFQSQRFYPNSTIPGGWGPNIEFKIKSFGIKIDSATTTDYRTGFVAPPWRGATPNYWTNPLNFGVDKANYDHHAINDSMKGIYKSTLLKGYTPNEVYRFGIQFFDKQGSPYFVKWICDVIMPDMTDDNPGGQGYDEGGIPLVNGNSLGQENGTFRTTFTPIGNQIDATRWGLVTIPPFLHIPQSYMQIPYIEWKVDVSSIKDKISGFEIVRVERSEADRFIAGTGCLYQTQIEGTKLYNPDSIDAFSPGAVVHKNSQCYLDGADGSDDTYRSISYTLDCFDFQTDQTPTFDSANDVIRTCGVLQSANGGNGLLGFTGATSPATAGYYWNKNYTFFSCPTDEYKMTQATKVGYDASTAASGGYTFINQSQPASAPHQVAHGNGTLYLETGANLPYSGYCSFIGVDEPGKILVQYRKYNRLRNQYGGNTYVARANNVYISTGFYVPVNDIQIVNTGAITFDTFGGDTFYGVFVKEKLAKYNANLSTTTIKSFIHYNPHIGYHNPELRNCGHFEFSGPAVGNTTYNGDCMGYDTTWSSENNVRKFYPKPVLINLTKEWDNRVYYSGIKINGETTDSWESFQPNDYWDVEGSYGPINSLISFKEKLYYIQKKGFGWLLVNVQSLVQDSSGATISIGRGDVIARHEYISTDVGTIHQWSVTRSPSSLLFVDATNKKVLRFGANGINSISDLNGQRGTFTRYIHDDILTSDNPIKYSGIHSTYDYYHDEYLITLLNDYITYDDENNPTLHSERNTISFNELLGKWNSFYSFTPTLYLNNKNQLWSPDPSNVNKLYIHNEEQYSKFYDIINPSTIKLLSNDNSRYTKMFNNIIFNTEAIADSPSATAFPASNLEGNTNIFDSTFDRFRAYNDYQNTDWVNLDTVTPTIRRVERQWNLQIPRNKVLYSINSSPNIFTDLGTKLYGERMRDKYLTIDLSYNNSNNYRLIFNNLLTKYIISDR